MAQAALRYEAPVERRAHLRVVRPKPRTRVSSRSKTRSNASVFQAFVFFAVVVVLVSGLGLGRVWLSVQATQASMDSAKLTRDIKLQQYEGDVLEVQESALATPSRVQAIASATMDMAPAKSVSYLDVRNTSGAITRGTVVAHKPQSTSVAGAVATALQAAASEARVLLVGDVGLSSSE
jgi:cell division protein FtsL